VFDDATGLTGRLLFDMGSAYATIPLKTPNKTIFNEMLFCSPAEAVQRRQNVGSSLFRTCYKAFDRIRECIADCRPGCDDGVLVKEELSNAVDMASHSIRRLFAGLDKAPGRASLRIEMRHIIGRHEELWLSRNRPGGLNESSGRLRNSLKFLE